MLSRRAFLKRAGALALFGLQGPPGQDKQTWQITGREVPELAPFDALMQAYMQARSIRNGALAITQGGRLVLARGYTWAEDEAIITQPSTLFRVASLSKPVTAAAIYHLVQAGLLDLYQPVAPLLRLQPPAGEDADPRLADITVAHLIQHAGGWDARQSFDPVFRQQQIAQALDVSLPLTTADIMRYMTGRPLDFAPGERFAYSNYGYLLLGRVVEVVAGLPYADYVRQTILAPLGIDAMRLARSGELERYPDEVAYYSRSRRLRPSALDDEGETPVQYGWFNITVMDSCAGWLASAVDMARFAAAFDNRYTHPVLEARIQRQMFAMPDVGANEYGEYYNGGWFIVPDGPEDGGGLTMWHFGTLPGTFAFTARRWDGLNWVVLFNQRDDRSRLDYYAIDRQLYEAADQIEQWPGHNLFERFYALPCTVTAPGPVNLREGPGTGYRTPGYLEAGQAAGVVAQTTGADGFTWWQLTGGCWVRDDVVTVQGCAKVSD